MSVVIVTASEPLAQNQEDLMAQSWHVALF